MNCEKKYTPVNNAVQRVRAAVMRVCHDQELLISYGEKLPVHSAEHSSIEIITIKSKTAIT